MRKNILAGIVLGFTALATVPALATPLAGKSLNNVVVNGTSYTVTFFDSALATIPAPQNVFTTFANANSAIAAIVSSSAYNTLIATANTSIPGSYYKGLIVPYSVTYGPAPLQYNSAVGASANNADLPLYYSLTNNPNTNGDYTTVGYAIAQFATAVPEPASLAVVAFGLFGLGWARRRFAK